jgi:hypothetical protein
VTGVGILELAELVQVAHQRLTRYVADAVDALGRRERSLIVVPRVQQRAGPLFVDRSEGVVDVSEVAYRDVFGEVGAVPRVPAAEVAHDDLRLVSVQSGRTGGATGARTPDLLHAMQMLSQLSYRPVCEREV